MKQIRKRNDGINLHNLVSTPYSVKEKKNILSVFAPSTHKTKPFSSPGEAKGLLSKEFK